MSARQNGAIGAGAAVAMIGSQVKNVAVHGGIDQRRYNAQHHFGVHLAQDTRVQANGQLTASLEAKFDHSGNIDHNHTYTVDPKTQRFVMMLLVLLVGLALVLGAGLDAHKISGAFVILLAVLGGICIIGTVVAHFRVLDACRRPDTHRVQVGTAVLAVLALASLPLVWLAESIVHDQTHQKEHIGLIVVVAAGVVALLFLIWKQSAPQAPVRNGGSSSEPTVWLAASPVMMAVFNVTVGYAAVLIQGSTPSWLGIFTVGLSAAVAIIGTAIAMYRKEKHNTFPAPVLDLAGTLMVIALVQYRFGPNEHGFPEWLVVSVCLQLGSRVVLSLPLLCTEDNFYLLSLLAPLSILGSEHHSSLARVRSKKKERKKK